MISANSLEGQRILGELDARRINEHVKAFIDAVIAEGGPSVLKQIQNRLYFPMKAGSISFGRDGTLSTIFRGRRSFDPSVFYGNWRQAIERAKHRYYEGLPARLEAQQARETAALGWEEEGRCAGRRGRGRSSGSGSGSGSALPPGFDGFDVFGVEGEDIPVPSFNPQAPLAHLKKGDKLKVGKLSFTVHRVIGTYQTDVYKAGVKRPYLLHQIDHERVGVHVMRGTMDTTLAEPPVLVVHVSQVKLEGR